MGTLGIRAMAVALISLSKHPEEKKDWIALTTSLPTILQARLKKVAFYPSGPGALLSFKEKSTV